VLIVLISKNVMVKDHLVHLMNAKQHRTATTPQTMLND